MTDTPKEEAQTYRLVEAPEGKGFFLTVQDVYVSSRPHVVLNNSQVQIAAKRECLSILGTTTMTDEEFEKAYRKDAAAAIEKAVGKSDDVDEDAAKASAEKAAREAEEAEAREAEEKQRLADEEAARVEEEKAHQAQLAEAAKEAEKANKGKKG